MPYPLPADTQSAYQSFKQCQNPGLLFDKYTPTMDGPASRQRALQTIQGCKLNARLMKAYRARWSAVTAAGKAITFEAKSDWRFVTGLGRGGPLEVGFTFHRIYGFPFIPGSSLKGLARSWARISILEADPKAPPEENKDFIAVFGHEHGEAEPAGSAIFFDAIPLDQPDLALDVMTPHFPDYYRSGGGTAQPPTDDQNPIPVTFLTVKEGVRFAFAVGWRAHPNPKTHQLAVQWLQMGLRELGAGAKTAAGYGYFSDFQKSGTSPTPGPASSKESRPQEVEAFLRDLNALPRSRVAGEINRFVTRWREAKVPDRHRAEMAQAILNKVEEAGRTKKSRGKSWFQELEKFITKHSDS